MLPKRSAPTIRLYPRNAHVILREPRPRNGGRRSSCFPPRRAWRVQLLLEPHCGWHQRRDGSRERAPRDAPDRLRMRADELGSTASRSRIARLRISLRAIKEPKQQHELKTSDFGGQAARMTRPLPLLHLRRDCAPTWSCRSSRSAKSFDCCAITCPHGLITATTASKLAPILGVAAESLRPRGAA